MNKYFYIFLTGILAVTFSSCNEVDYSTKELYKPVVYLLSKETYNVYSQPYPFNDGNEVTGYLSIGCGGTLSNPEAFTVELEPDTVLLKEFNTGNFDIDSSKYAMILPQDRYQIESYSVNYPAENTDQYVKMAIKVNPDGLSPDSTYFIPLSIKSVSNYEANPDKSNVLFRIELQNYYAGSYYAGSPSNETNYQGSGSILAADSTPVSPIRVTALVRALSKNSVRVYVGANSQTNKSTLDEIKKFSMKLTVDENDSVAIAPYDSTQIQVEAVKNVDGWNIYEEVRKDAVTTNTDKYFNLYYRYRTVKTQGNPPVYDDWIMVQETLKRLEN